MAEPEKFTVAAIGDIHVKDQSDPLRDMFGEIAQAADALVLCGDLTDTGTVQQAERLAEDLRGCPIPVIGVLGNHDYECGKVDEVRSILTQAGLRLLDGSAVELDGVGFVGVKGFAGGFGRRMLGSFGEPETKEFVSVAVSEAMRLENAMRTVKAQRAMVVLHYAPIPETIEGEPLEIYPFLGSSRLAETIDRFTVSAVVHGHAHRGVYQGHTPGGAPVYNVAWAIEKPSGRPYALIDL
ncbi:metallophosphoesterase [Inquilinus sp.]|jgi:Icc-related predicted phosphoesterase|uniref:metallophosphoesterase family protein n=1 Tax=Inquilinus sp. TaxID=1932117 RepID=UPI003783C759